MKKYKIKKENKDVVDGWLGTYGDMITLLMAFFVMLYSTADPDPGKYGDLADAMKEAFAAKNSNNEFINLENKLKDLIYEKKIDDQFKIESGPKGLKILIPGKTLFQSGSADIIDDMKPIIKEISNIITELLDKSNYNDYIIEVEGHTDNDPILQNNSIFSSNWDLSAIRATGVVEILHASGINLNKLKSIARGETKPITPNTDQEGNKLINRSKNRRVEIYINKFTNQ